MLKEIEIAQIARRLQYLINFKIMNVSVNSVH